MMACKAVKRDEKLKGMTRDATAGGNSIIGYETGSDVESTQSVRTSKKQPVIS